MRVVVKDLAVSKLVKKFGAFLCILKLHSCGQKMTNDSYSKPTESNRHLSTIS